MRALGSTRRSAAGRVWGRRVLPTRALSRVYRGVKKCALPESALARGPMARALRLEAAAAAAGAPQFAPASPEDTPAVERLIAAAPRKRPGEGKQREVTGMCAMRCVAGVTEGGGKGAREVKGCAWA